MCSSIQVHVLTPSPNTSCLMHVSWFVKLFYIKKPTQLTTIDVQTFGASVFFQIPENPQLTCWMWISPGCLALVAKHSQKIPMITTHTL